VCKLGIITKNLTNKRVWDKKEVLGRYRNFSEVVKPAIKCWGYVENYLWRDCPLNPLKMYH